MNCKYYEQKINDVIVKCPIEAGIEILVYNLLDKNIDREVYSLVDINRIWKKVDSRLSTEAGIPDIAILSPDFVFKQEDIGKVYGFVEVKAAHVSLREIDQVSGQMSNVTHYIYTNGIVWKYYRNKELIWEKNLSINKISYSSSKIEIHEKKFKELEKEIKKIQWDKFV